MVEIYFSSSVGLPKRSFSMSDGWSNDERGTLGRVEVCGLGGSVFKGVASEGVDESTGSVDTL